MGFAGFPPGMVAFYTELAANNEREWWKANIDRYRQDVDEPVDRLVGELEQSFGPIKRFRPYRDVRFSADKRPYQEHTSFATERPGGVLYVQLGASGAVIAGGRWQPSPGELRRFRVLADDPSTAAAIDRELAARAEDGLVVDDESGLKTAPRGYPRDHPRLDLLRMTRLAVSTRLPAGPWLQTEEALETITRLWASADRWNEWLGQHVPAEGDGARRGTASGRSHG